MTRIRPATTDDVPAMLAAHRAAVQRTASGYYAQHVIASWSASSNAENAAATITRMRHNLVSGAVLSFVAEDDAAIVGFAELIAEKGELNAVYVHPDHGRKGIGAALLAAVERAARSCGLAELHMDASLSAEAFYLQHGYSAYGRAPHALRDGPQMASVQMRKTLT